MRSSRVREGVERKQLPDPLSAALAHGPPPRRVAEEVGDGPGPGLGIGRQEPVSYTHLTLPTKA